jgi:hypothetical protein
MLDYVCTKDDKHMKYSRRIGVGQLVDVDGTMGTEKHTCRKIKCDACERSRQVMHWKLKR